MRSKHIIALILILQSVGAIAATHVSEKGVLYPGAPTYLDLGAGVLIGGGVGLPGVNARLSGQLAFEPNIYLGAETGFFFYSSNYTSGVVIPLLGTVSTIFDATPAIHPTLGLSLGPSLSTGSRYSTPRFTLFLDPGLKIDVSQTLVINLITRFGAMGSTFVALPQISLSLFI